jgi:hypothetical protein
VVCKHDVVALSTQILRHHTTIGMVWLVVVLPHWYGGMVGTTTTVLLKFLCCFLLVECGGMVVGEKASCCQVLTLLGK